MDSVLSLAIQHLLARTLSYSSSVLPLSQSQLLDKLTNYQTLREWIFGPFKIPYILSRAFLKKCVNLKKKSKNYTKKPEKVMASHSSTLAWKIPWTEEPGGCSPWGHKESNTTERLHFHFSLSCIGEGNGNPLQCSCLENPRDGGAWWAAVYGVAQSRTRLKQLSSSSSIQRNRQKS